MNRSLIERARVLRELERLHRKPPEPVSAPRLHRVYPSSVSAG